MNRNENLIDEIFELNKKLKIKEFRLQFILDNFIDADLLSKIEDADVFNECYEIIYGEDEYLESWMANHKEEIEREEKEKEDAWNNWQYEFAKLELETFGACIIFKPNKT